MENERAMTDFTGSSSHVFVLSSPIVNSPFRYTFLLAGLLLFCSSSFAQRLRFEPERLFFKARLGSNLYDGDRAFISNPDFNESIESLGPGWGFEVGYQLSQRFSVGIAHLTGHYPSILNQKGHPPFIKPITRVNSSKWRHMVGLLGRVHFFQKAWTSPYLHLGLTSGWGLINGDTKVGYGVRIGGGFELSITRALDIFTELDAVYMYPDQAMDLANLASESDPFGFIGFGIRYHFSRKQATPVEVVRLEGPVSLKTGEAGTFTAYINTIPEDGVFFWDFGDGARATGLSAGHIYSEAGTYTVTFEAVNGSARDARTLTTLVTPPLPLAAPIIPAEIVAFQSTPARPQVNEPVRFTGIVRGTPPVSCHWDFGDGTTGTDCDMTHRYATPGTFPVTFEAANTGTLTRYTREVEVVSDLCAELEELSPVYFGESSGELSLEMRSILRENFGKLSSCPTLTLEVKGYALPQERNAGDLAATRARTVAQYYINLGFPRRQVMSVGDEHTVEIEAGGAQWPYRRVTSRAVIQ